MIQFLKWTKYIKRLFTKEDSNWPISMRKSAQHDTTYTLTKMAKIKKTDKHKDGEQ